MEIIFIIIASLLGANPDTNILIKNEVTATPTHQESIRSCMDFEISRADCERMLPQRTSEWKIPSHYN